MKPKKTMRDLISPLTGSAFRRVHRDGRTRFVRQIMTLGRLSREGLRT